MHVSHNASPTCNSSSFRRLERHLILLKKKKMIRLQTLRSVPDKMQRCTREQEGAAGNFDSQPVITACASQPASQRGEHVILLFPATPVAGAPVCRPSPRSGGHSMMCSRWYCSPGTARDAEGNTSHRDVPAHEVCKSGSRDRGEREGGGGAVGSGGEAEISREWNSQARAGPPHLGG